MSNKQEGKRTGKVQLLAELHYIKLVAALKEAIVHGDPLRFSLEDARELENLGRDIRILLYNRDGKHEHSETCDHCRESKRHEEVFSRRDPDELIALIQSLRDDLVITQEDLSWHEAIMDGTWPNARFILTQSLDKCPAETVNASGA